MDEIKKLVTLRMYVDNVLFEISKKIVEMEICMDIVYSVSHSEYESFRKSRDNLKETERVVRSIKDKIVDLIENED